MFFHDLRIESHRSMKRVAELILALEAEGVTVTTTLDTACDLAFCGAFETSGPFLDAVSRENSYRAERGLNPVPTVYFNWDLYPWQYDGPNPSWRRYAEDMKRATAILVPSESVRKRTKEFCKRESTVVLSACNPFDAEPFDGGWVLDVMRHYSGDPNTGAVKRACDELGIPCIETGANLPKHEFERAVAGARLLVSSYYEASTGGLTLLEGYRLGKRVLISDSPYQGANDYFPVEKGLATRFRWNDTGDLKSKIARLMGHSEDWMARANGEMRWMGCWVAENYSDTAFSQRMARALREVLHAAG